MELEHVFKIALLFLFFNSVLTQQVPLSSKSEKWALLDLRSSLGIRATEWPRKAEPCFNWTGIQCQEGRVTGINLSGLRRTRVGQLNPRFSVDSLGNFTWLSSFNSSGFSLPGPIPEWLGQRLITLQVLDLRSSSIFGSIPASLGTLGGLNTLYLSDNSITGIIPAALGKLQSLSILDLAQNFITGSIPNTMSALGNLTSLDLSSNFLAGVIPSEFGLLSSLKILRLQNNSLSGSIPSQLSNLSQLVELDLGYNFLSGSLPEDLGGLKSLQKILIGNNELAGALSARLFLNLTRIQYIFLSKNQFDGQLPDSLWSLTHLRFLDVSGNKFTGILPNLTASLDDAAVFFNFSSNLLYGSPSFEIDGIDSIDLSDNYFEGLAPTSNISNITVTSNCFQSVPGQRSMEDCRNFYANRGLIFNNSELPESMGPSSSEPSKHKTKITYIMVGVFGGIGLIVILVLALVLMQKICAERNANGRGVANVMPVSLEDSPRPPNASPKLSGLGDIFVYEQILHATSNFSEANLIKNGHSGDIFRGTLEDGKLVIIKRVDLQFLEKKAFNLELNLFSKVKHSRLVPLLGHCLEHENEKILVYKYMSNGDLSNSLYRTNNMEGDGLQSLDWITRLKIAIGAAEGLSYLHHECNPPLVHRDIQASSILLDDKYEVRLGSLSKVCFLGADSNQNMKTRLLQVPQTLEKSSSGSSSTACSYDVYCFGKVLLELVTGKLGISNSDDASTNEWLENNISYISIYEKELVAKIIDQSLIIDEDLLEEVWAVAIVAKSCLNPQPSRRPLMRHILRALENPFKVMREENFSSAKLRTTSSTRSWTAAFFDSWHHSSSESANILSQTREAMCSLKYAGRAGSHGSGTQEYPSSNKRSSSEIFPEPSDMRDVEQQDEH